MTLKAFKYRLYPTEKQKEFLEKHFGSCRFVYNHFLALRRDAWQRNKQSISGFECKRQLKNLKTEFPWLKDVNSQSLQDVVLNLEKAYRRFFKGFAGYPRFKTKNGFQSFAVPQNFGIEDDKLYIPKAKDGIKVKLHRAINGIPVIATISKTPSGKYFVSVISKTVTEKLPITNRKIGVDLGLTHFATLSGGEKIEHPKTLLQSERLLKKLQRQLSRKEKSSKNRNKARLKVAKLNEKITNQRNDFLHKLSYRLINENQVICLEDLNVKGMVRNRYLAKAISDSGWGELCRQMQYKADWYGRTVKQIPRFYPSSKECSICRFVMTDLKLSRRTWTCPNCGTVHDRDDNASSIILRVGQGMPEVTPVERMASVSSILSMKQVNSKKQETLAS